MKFCPTYNKKEYNSNDGMLTYVWGPSMWHFLHCMSFNYPAYPTKENKKEYYEFLLSLQNTLPCGKCRNNLKKNLKVLKFSKKMLKNRDTFSKFIYDLHNHINLMLGKKKYKTYREVRDCYENFRSRCKNKEVKKKKHKTCKKEKKENGCTNSLYGINSQCVINIVPRNKKRKSFKIDKRCIAVRK